MSHQNDPLIIAGQSYNSRLLIGTGKYKDLEETRIAIEASGAEIVTVAVRRTNIGQNPDEPNLLDIITPDKYTILPNTAGCFNGFKVMVYTSDDPIVAQELESLGCVAIMPLGSMIGSGLGILNPHNINVIMEDAKVPVLVDAGVGTASEAAVAMEMGCDAVLMNSAIAGARNPVLMASAMRKAIEAGREAFLAGRMPRKRYASASSPMDGTIIG